MKNALVFLFTVLTFPLLFAQNQRTPTDLSELFSSVKWRCIGPFRGGRSVAASGVVGDPLTYYMGTTGGGMWKTTDAGQHWSNISDGFFQTGSVGAVAVAESDPNIVYVGMGEHAVRGVMTTHGDGVYKSTDAGKTWQHLGLELTRQIAGISIHPTNPDIVYVAAQGALYGPTEERGIYRSTDGGESWSKILFIDEKTGCADLAMDMSNPSILYAAMWEHQRLPWQVISGGPGSGLYKSTDGGDSWQKIQEGLPDELGKMSISVCRSNPDKLYALVESDTEKEQGGLFASNDGGKNWSRVSKDHRLVMRAWYYIETFVDPNDENTVYVLNAPALRSIDGGKTWERLTGTHGDYHDLWINPHNSNNLVIANDGGAAISFNQGDTWSTQSNMPTAQFYRVNVDNAFPYRVYGGQQDNSSVRIESRNLFERSIGRQNWTYSAGGESAFLAFDPDNPSIVLGGSYQGAIEALHADVGDGHRIMAAPHQHLAMQPKDMRYRFNWNAPIIWSQHEENTFYHGAQVLLKTQDLGVTWTEVSPDLTRDDENKQGLGGVPYTNEGAGGENYNTLSYVVESPHEAGVIWTGSDDGLVHLTRDNGDTWTNVTPPGLAECLVNAIDVSPHDPATAYVATTRYKFNDLRPGLYKTTDYGATWTAISNGIPDGACTRVVREDPVRRGLLFAGTETGLYVSFDDGLKWQLFQLNLPIVPITDLIIRHGDLVAATQGRSFWILDDLSLLRQYEPTRSVVLYQPEDAYRVGGGSPLNQTSAKFTGMSSWQGVNPATGLVIYYQLPELSEESTLQLEILDENGELVRRFSSEKDPDFQSYPGGPSADPLLPKEKGLNRFVWNMRYPTLLGAPKAYIEGSYRGHKAPPGEYELILRAGDTDAQTTFRILAVPSIEAQAADYAAQHQMLSQISAAINTMHTAVNQMQTYKQRIQGLLERLDDETHSELSEQGRSLIEQIDAWDGILIQRKSQAYDDVINFPNGLTAEYLFLKGQLDENIPAVTQAIRDRFAELQVRWQQLQQSYQELDTAVSDFQRGLEKTGIGLIRDGE